MKARRLVYPIHTGSLLGWPTKLLALIAALVAASLPVTGFLIWMNRKKKPAKGKSNKSKRPIPSHSGKIPYLSRQGYHEQ